MSASSCKGFWETYEPSNSPRRTPLATRRSPSSSGPIEAAKLHELLFLDYLTPSFLCYRSKALYYDNYLSAEILRLLSQSAIISIELDIVVVTFLILVFSCHIKLFIKSDIRY